MSDQKKNTSTALKKKITFFIVLAIATPIIIYLFTTSEKSETQIIDQLTKPFSVEFKPPHFDPSQVTRFSWEVEKQILEFSKTDSGQWSPFAQEGSISYILESLAFSQLERSQKNTENPVIRFSLQIEDQNIDGFWNGQIVAFTAGQLKGFTASSENLTKSFSQGRFAFYDRTFSWCPSRPDVIRLFQLQSKVEFKFKDNQWTLNSQTFENPNKLESWLAKVCQISADQFVDPKVAPLSSPEVVSTVEIHFIDGELIQIQALKSGFFRINQYDFFFRSDSFTKVFNQLKSVSN